MNQLKLFPKVHFEILQPSLICQKYFVYLDKSVWSPVFSVFSVRSVQMTCQIIFLAFAISSSLAFALHWNHDCNFLETKLSKEYQIYHLNGYVLLLGANRVATRSNSLCWATTILNTLFLLSQEGALAFHDSHVPCSQIWSLRLSKIE